MIVHVALFRWKEGTPQERIGNALKQVKQLRNRCVGINDILCGKNYHPESKGLTHGVIVLAENQHALDEYRKHPDHKIIAQEIAEMEEDGIGFDFKNLLQ